MLLKLISLAYTLQTIRAAGTYSLAGCYSFDDLSSYLTSQGEYTYQTNSYCEKLCSSYAVAATLDGSTCYCGNDLPSSISSVSSSNCDVSCQGYSTEICGGSGYLSVYTNGEEDTGDSSSSGSSSTKSGSTTTLSTSASQSQSQSQSQTTATTTTSSSTTAASTSQTSTTQTSTTGASTTSSSATTTSQAATSVQVITSVISGSEAVITATQTIAPTTSSTSTSDSDTSSSSSSSDDSSSDSSNGLSKGAIAGIAVGSVIGVFGIIGLIIGCFCYLRHQNDDDDEEDEDVLDESGSSINNRYNTEKPIHNDFQFYGSQMNQRSSMMNGFQNPNAPFFSFDEINGHKRLSNGSLPDARHEKTLRIVNPDDELNDTTLKHHDDDDGHMTDDSDDSDWRK